MAVNKSVLQELELESGSRVYVQINTKASISIESKELQYCVWLTIDELQALADTINKALEESSEL